MIPLNDRDNNKQTSKDVKTALQIEAGKSSFTKEETVKRPGVNNGEEDTKHVIASGENNDMEDTDVDNLLHRS